MDFTQVACHVSPAWTAREVNHRGEVTMDKIISLIAVAACVVALAACVLAYFLAA
jgi:hypothetical protein